MAATSHGQPIPAAVPPPPINLKTPYATILNSKAKDKDTTYYETFDVPIKPPKNINGRHTISWSKKEIQQSILQTNLQYAIMGKFKYGNIDIHELRKVIPSQCGIKGECIIGLLDTRIVLIRCIDREDYINLLSTSGFWLKLKKESVRMRTLKWDIWQDFKKEPPIAMAWISLPNLPPNFFADHFVKSIALSVGKPMQVDLATKTNSRPSCARVKVEVNLLSELPDVVEVGEHDENYNVISSKWIKIRYDYLPKYCKTCCLQGHDELECYSLHPDLYQKRNNENKHENVDPDNQNISKKKEEDVVAANQKEVLQITNDNPPAIAQTNILTNGRLVFNEHPRQEWQQGRKQKNGSSHSSDQINQGWKTKSREEDKGHKAGLIELADVNNFSVLNIEDEEQVQQLEEGVVDLLQTSDKVIHDNNEQLLGNIMNVRSTHRAIQGINSRNDEKGSQNKLESLENIEVQSHVVQGYKEVQNMRAHAVNINNPMRAHAVDGGAGNVNFSKVDDIILDNVNTMGPCTLSSATRAAPTTQHAEFFTPNREGHKGAQEIEETRKKHDMMEEALGNKILEKEQVHMMHNTQACAHGPTPHDLRKIASQIFVDSNKQLDLDIATPKEKESGDHRIIHSEAHQNDLLCAKQNHSNVPNDLSKDHAQKVGQLEPSRFENTGVETTKEWVNKSFSKEATVQKGVGACLENKTAVTVPSQSDKVELEGERSVNDQTCTKQNDEHNPQSGGSSMETSPSHSSNVLVPPQDLEVIFKLDRLLKLHGTSQITMEIAKKFSNEEHQIILKRDEDKTLSPILTYIRKGLIAPPEALIQKKATEPTKPMRVQPTRSAKSNSTCGK